MANNKSFEPSYRRAVAVTAPAVPTSGVPVRWGQMTGVALTDLVVATGLTTVEFGPAAWRLPVTDVVGGGIAVGDQVYLNHAATQLGNDPRIGRLFGYAEEVVLAAQTTTICVWHLPNGTVGTLDLQANALAANVAGRAAMEDDYFDAATVLAKVADDALTEANLTAKVADDAITAAVLTAKVADDAFTAAVVLAKVEDDAIVEDKIDDDSLTGTVIAVSAADAAIPAVPVVLRYDVPDMATAALDFNLDQDVLILDAWLKKVDVVSSAHAHTIQVQTVGGAANITDAISLNAVAQHTIVRAATVYDTAIVAGAGGIRIDVVRDDGAGEIACEVYLLAVKV